MKIGFRSLHPLTGFIFYASVFFLSITATHPIMLVSVFVCAFLYYFKLCGKQIISFFTKLIIPLIILSAAFNGIFSHFGNTVLFILPGGDNFTLESVVYGLVFAVRASVVILWLGSFNEVITSDKIIFLFGRISPKTALIISMALRFIPLIITQSDEIIKAEKGIGANGASGNFPVKIKNAAKRLSILVSWSLERGIDTSNSMTARGYGLLGRTSYNSWHFSLKDGAFCILSIISMLLFYLSKNTLTAIYNPSIIIPFPAISDILISVYFSIFMLLPLITDTVEEKRWSIS